SRCLLHALPISPPASAPRSLPTRRSSDLDAEESLKLIEEYRVTHSQWVPTMFVRMLKLPEATRERYDLSSMTHAIHAAAPWIARSEEHTSELQSRFDLVCRLLRENNNTPS